MGNWLSKTKPNYPKRYPKYPNHASVPGSPPLTFPTSNLVGRASHELPARSPLSLSSGPASDRVPSPTVCHRRPQADGDASSSAPGTVTGLPLARRPSIRLNPKLVRRAWGRVSHSKLVPGTTHIPNYPNWDIWDLFHDVPRPALVANLEQHTTGDEVGQIQAQRLRPNLRAEQTVVAVGN